MVPPSGMTGQGETMNELRLTGKLMGAQELLNELFSSHF
jgi:hypothetical protein